MKSFIGRVVAGFVLLGMASSLAYAQEDVLSGTNCENPSVPTIAENVSDDLDLLLDAQDAVQAYVAGSNEFIDCVDQYIARRNGRGLGQDEINALTALINANIDAQELVASTFNERVQVYQASQ